jgi:hypothetical protein
VNIGIEGFEPQVKNNHVDADLEPDGVAPADVR